MTSARVKWPALRAMSAWNSTCISKSPISSESSPGVLGVDGFQYLVALLQEVAFQAQVSLLQVPGAAAGGAEAVYDADKGFKGCDFAGEIRWGTFVFHGGIIGVRFVE